jgi:hypothetical protein
MQVTYGQTVSADCTSDPHPVAYGAPTDPEVLAAMFTDIIRVLESDMIIGVRVVRASIDGQAYESDRYDESDYSKKGKQATNEESKKHKTYGLYFQHDGGDCDDDEKPIPPGLSGVKFVRDLALKDGAKFDWISIGIIWTFAGSSSCSDYITCGEGDGNTVNYGSQDWWRSSKGYKPWCAQMEEFLGKDFPHE